MTIFHYTCSHAVARMTPDFWGLFSLTPRSPHGILWLTDLDLRKTMLVPPARALGLTSHTLDCDRTEYQFELVDDTTVQPWAAVKRNYPVQWVFDLEHADRLLQPAHWFVSTVPELARLMVPAVADA